ncbi:molybdopterin-synthase adenylyltransferase MoeB [Sphingomonas sp. CROZ-RG-20F-R02-07]|uniref:HesA/MoeB/ThiF family protein n=1 Tax=Sphingomonas sp. CROZ-RG-20F-R02-07 TaxID=2914832 RepID=UPI001F59AB5B|nr:molybdopterin-synthase adenylyltransferase MoeB [Sphingomonas sp. CROZ-RG-20F-R02-07]
MTPPLSDDELDRYARHIVLKEFGGAGQTRLKAARVAIVGAGGIGSPAIQYLAAAGVGHLRLIDDDRVEPSNLQRQTIFVSDDAGTAKVEAAAAAARRINPHVAVEPVAVRIDPANAATLLAGVDVVLDGCDNFATRFAVADAAFAAHIPLVSAAVGQFEGQLGVYRGWEPVLPCYRCFVGETPERAETSCAEDGVLGPVTGILGSLAALEVMRAIAPFGDEAAGKLLLVDLLALRFRTLRLPKDPGCAGCGS